MPSLQASASSSGAMPYFHWYMDITPSWPSGSLVPEAGGSLAGLGLGPLVGVLPQVTVTTSFMPLRVGIGNRAGGAGWQSRRRGTGASLADC